MSKTLIALVLACMLLLCACAQPASAPVQAEQPAAQAVTPEPTEAPTPTPTATPEPTPTPTPRVESATLETELFNEGGISATVTGFRYTEDQSVEVTLSITNKSKQDLSILGGAWGYGMSGSVNGYTVTFYAQGTGPNVTAGEENAIVPLEATIDAHMQIKQIQKITIAFNGYLQRSFDPKCKPIVNPNCPEDYVQEYTGDATPIYENAQMRYYYLGMDEVNPTVYLHAECLVKKHVVRMTPVVCGYSLAGRLNVEFSADGQHAIIAIPYSDTMIAYGLTALSTAGVCVEPYTNGQTFYGKAYAFPVVGEALTEAPRYKTTDAPILESDKGITLYLEKTERSGADSYMPYTDYEMVCVNNTENILWVYPESFTMDGVKYDVGSYGTISPFTVGKVSARAYTDVPAGTEAIIQMRIMDVRANFRNVVVEKVTVVAK